MLSDTFLKLNRKLNITPKDSVEFDDLLTTAFANRGAANRRKASKNFSPGGTICSRFKAFQRLEGMGMDFHPPGPDLLRLFESGNAAHDSFQQKILPLFPGLWGHWACANCSFVYEACFQPEGRCKECGVYHKSPEYREVYVKHSPFDREYFNMTGYIDGIWWNDGQWHILELKSVSEDQFNEVSRRYSKTDKTIKEIVPRPGQLPKDAHVHQGMVYLKLLNLTYPEVFAEETRGDLFVVYINRTNYETKTFQLEYNEGAYGDMLAKMEMTKNAVDREDAFLAMRHCSNKNSVLAKRCPKREVCFPKK